MGAGKTHRQGDREDEKAGEMTIHGSYDKAAIVQSFYEATEAQQLKSIKRALKCGCPSCKVWLEQIPLNLITKAKGKSRKVR